MTTLPNVNRRGLVRFVLVAVVLVGLGAATAAGVYALRAQPDTANSAAALMQRLDSLDQRLQGQSAQVAVLQKGLADIDRKIDLIAAALTTVGADTALLRERTEKHAVATPAVRPVQRRALQRQAPGPVSPPPAESARVLGVDTWNGEPVVAVKVGGRIEFARPGDKVGESVLEHADAHGQTAHFRRAVPGMAQGRGAAGAAMGAVGAAHTSSEVAP